MYFLLTGSLKSVFGATTINGFL